MALRALEFLIQNTEPSGTTLVDARNGFNKLIRWQCCEMCGIDVPQEQG